MLKALLKELRSYRRGKCSCYRQSQEHPCKQRPGLVLPCLFRTHRQTVSAGTSTTTPMTEAAPPPCWGRLQPNPALLAQMGCTALWATLTPTWMVTEPQRMGPMSWSGHLPALLPTITYTRLFKHVQSFQSTRKCQSIPTFTPPQPFQYEAFIYRDVPCSSHCRARVLPHTFLFPMDPVGSTEGQPALHRACWCLNQSCSMHTAHTSSRWVCSRLGPGRGMDTAQGPNWTQTGSHQPAGEQQDRHPGLTTCEVLPGPAPRGVGEKRDAEQYSLSRQVH